MLRIQYKKLELQIQNVKTFEYFHNAKNREMENKYTYMKEKNIVGDSDQSQLENGQATYLDEKRWGKARFVAVAHLALMAQMSFPQKTWMPTKGWGWPADSSRIHQRTFREDCLH